MKVHVGKEEVMRLEQPWRVLQHHPNSDFEHFLLVCDLREEVIAPLAFSYWKGGRCAGIVCGRIEKILLSPTIGYLKLPAFKAKCLTVIHEGILGDIDQEGQVAVIKSTNEHIGEAGLDLAMFYHLPERFSGHLGFVYVAI